MYYEKVVVEIVLKMTGPQLCVFVSIFFHAVQTFPLRYVRGVTEDCESTECEWNKGVDENVPGYILATNLAIVVFAITALIIMWATDVFIRI